MQNGVVKSVDELPSAVTLSHLGLQTVYDETRSKLQDRIAKAPKTMSMTTDLWTDNHRRRSYVTLTLHFRTSDFVMHDTVLRTVVFPEARTAENIKPTMNETVNQFILRISILFTLRTKDLM